MCTCSRRLIRVLSTVFNLNIFWGHLLTPSFTDIPMIGTQSCNCGTSAFTSVANLLSKGHLKLATLVNAKILVMTLYSYAWKISEERVQKVSPNMYKVGNTDFGWVRTPPTSFFFSSLRQGKRLLLAGNISSLSWSLIPSLSWSFARSPKWNP